MLGVKSSTINLTVHVNSPKVVVQPHKYPNFSHVPFFFYIIFFAITHRFDRPDVRFPAHLQVLKIVTQLRAPRKFPLPPPSSIAKVVYLTHWGPPATPENVEVQTNK
jgi:hypothetical protein